MPRLMDLGLMKLTSNKDNKADTEHAPGEYYFERIKASNKKNRNDSNERDRNRPKPTGISSLLS